MSERSAGASDRLSEALADRYSVERELGEGGMATVYLAEDPKHERQVAIKVLRPELAAVIGAERFLAEIKTTANLQHPHILPLFDSGEADGFLYYVMPYIEGENLRDRIEREGQLGVEDAVRIARDVADALDYAHRNDIIHRDIKPANILLHDGRPVVADFGIALAISAAGGGRMTETGLSLGTPHYMSPEQASADRDLSARSDIYSLGCVLYEMLAGQPPHTGPSAQSILVRILTEDPRDVSELRRTVPPHVAATVTKSIEKLPADRFDTARQFMEALEDPSFTHVHVPRTPKPSLTSEAPPSTDATPTKLVRGMAAALVALVALAAWGWLRPAPEPPRPMATRAYLPVDDDPNRIATIVISPDGSTLAYVSRGNPQERKLYVRRVDEENFRIHYDGDAFWPVFSPEGDWIAFEAENALYKIALSGGAPRVVAPERAQVAQPHWGDDGTIVFHDGGDIYRVPETGGEPTLVADLDEEDLQNPHLLPGGRGLLASAYATFTTYFVDLGTGDIEALIPGGVAPKYVETGHVLYTDEEGGLWARPFNPGTGEVSGEATPVLQGIGRAINWVSRYSVSRTGTLVYSVGGGGGGAGEPGELVVVGLDGSEDVAPLPPRLMRTVRWAPDGERVAYSGTEPGDLNGPQMIYEYNVELQTTPTRLTSEGEVAYYPAWSPDGTRIAYSSNRDDAAGRHMFVKNVLDDSPPVRIFSAPNARARPDQWLAGDSLVFTFGNSPVRNNSWTMQVPDSTTARAYIAAEGNRLWARVAPQGDLAAYQTNETGRNEIFVRAFPEARQPTPVSSGGGRRPMWAPDGNTIYYWREYPGADSLFAARIQREPAFRVLSTDFVLAGDYRDPEDWDLHPDGDRFVTTRLVESGSTAAAVGVEPERHIIVTNWFTELLAAVGEGN